MFFNFSWAWGVCKSQEKLKKKMLIKKIWRGHNEYRRLLVLWYFGKTGRILGWAEGNAATPFSLKFLLAELSLSGAP